MGQMVESQGVISDHGIDVVYVTITTSISTEIMNSIQKDFSHVKRVEIIGGLFFPSFS